MQVTGIQIIHPIGISVIPYHRLKHERRNVKLYLKNSSYTLYIVQIGIQFVIDFIQSVCLKITRMFFLLGSRNSPLRSRIST